MWKSYICLKLKFSHGMDDFWRRDRPRYVSLCRRDRPRYNFFLWIPYLRHRDPYEPHWSFLGGGGQRDDFSPNITQCIDELLRGEDSRILDFMEELCKRGEFDVVDLLLDGSKYMVNDLYYFK